MVNNSNQTANASTVQTRSAVIGCLEYSSTRRDITVVCISIKTESPYTLGETKQKADVDLESVIYMIYFIVVIPCSLATRHEKTTKYSLQMMFR